MNGACEVTTKSEDISIKSTTEISASEEVTESKEEAGSESEEDLSLSTGVTKPSILFGEEIFTSTVEPITNEEIVSCEHDSSDPLCTTQKNIMHSSSLEEMFTEAGTTTEISSIHQEIVTERDIFDKENLSQFSSSSGKKKEVSDLITDESTLLPSTTDILIKPSVTTSKNIDYTFSTSETNITSHGATKDEKEEENLTSTDNRKDTSTELTSKELTETDHVPPLSTINSAEINAEQEVTTKVSPHEITEFVKESETFTEILNKLSSISTESIPESVTSQSISTLGEVLFQGTTTTSSSTEIKSTASSEVDYSCENSEDCAYISSSESCDEFGNCDSVTSSFCESGICSEEETEDQSKPDTVFLPTKNQSFVTESQSSEQLATIEIQHTTVAGVPTTLIAQDTENNSTMINTDTRRSTTTSKPQHILSLKVKILLEHINEKKEKHNLIEVEKHVSFNENLIQQDHPDLLEQLRALNESVNNETLSALLNCNGSIREKLGNLIEKTNINSMQSNDVDKNHKELEYTDFSAFEDLISEQFTSERALAKNEDFQYSEYDQENDRENEVLYRRRRRRSLDDKKGDLDELDIVTKSSIDPNELSVTTNSLNVSELQTTSLTETTHPSTTTNNPEEGTNNVTENERNTTTERNDGVTFSTIKDNDTDSTTFEYQDVNVTKESVQLSTTTNNPQEETSDTVRTENGNDTTTEIVLSTVPSISENVTNETKIEVVQVLPEIQEDVSTGLKHVYTELTQNNLTSVNDTNKVVKTNLLLHIIADPKDNRVHSRIRRAAAEEVGHWSNERIREISMGGSLRTFTEFTLYKVLS
ncbi:hypothetical protein ACFW04_003192 [Cataglyphis niger]